MKLGAVAWAALVASILGAGAWASLQAGIGRASPAPGATAGARAQVPATSPPASARAASLVTVAPPSPELVTAAEGVPDFNQSDPRLGVPGDGASYCGPVAVSNWLLWLAERGYPELTPPGSTRDERQIALVQRLSGRRYMATSPVGGTGTLGVLRGLERWILDAGYGVEHLSYAGWRAHDRRHATGERRIELDWLSRELAAGSVAVIHVGWYRPPTRWERALQRRGGHWLTLVDVTLPASGAAESGVLWVHDPAPYAGATPRREQVSVHRIGPGWLLADGQRIAADGALELGPGMHRKRDEDRALIDGVVVLRLKPLTAGPAASGVRRGSRPASVAGSP